MLPILCTATILPVLQYEGKDPELYEVSYNILNGCTNSYRVLYNMLGCRLYGPEDFDILILLSFFKYYFFIKADAVHIPFQSFFGFSSVNTLQKNCPNTLGFSLSSVAVTGFPLESIVFSSPIVELVFCRLLIYFQNFFGFTLHSAAMFCCSFLFMLRVSLHTRFHIVLYF